MYTLVIRVLVKKVGFQGKHKLANRWEEEVYKVKGQPNPDIPVFVVEKEAGGGTNRTLHRNMLLPVNFLPFTTDDAEEKVNVHPKQTVKRSVRRPNQDLEEESVSENVDSSEDEESRFVAVSALNPKAPAFKPRQSLGRLEMPVPTAEPLTGVLVLEDGHTIDPDLEVQDHHDREDDLHDDLDSGEEEEQIQEDPGEQLSEDDQGDHVDGLEDQADVDLLPQPVPDVLEEPPSPENPVPVPRARRRAPLPPPRIQPERDRRKPVRYRDENFATNFSQQGQLSDKALTVMADCSTAILNISTVMAS